MIAVDAGTHLASIVRILQQQMPLYSRETPPSGYSKVLEEGPFAGIKCTGYSARANALHIFREIMHAFLITHPHLDHLAAMGVNTPALEYGREAKTIVALDSTIEAIKAHIFNDSIWPNLSDEGSGVGFVTYRRLKEGGNHRLGQGDARGYVRVCESLATLCMGVTHGKCKAKAVISPHNRSESASWHDSYSYPSHIRRLSRISTDHESYFAAVHGHGHSHNHGYSISMPGSQITMPPGPTTPQYTAMHTPTMTALDLDHTFDPVKSSAFFILNEETAAEILIFGDIEPDTVSMSPQNYKIWKTAAPKVASGNLKAIFIECSYDDSVKDSDLYGHLCPRHLIDELLFLAKEVADYKIAKRANTPLPSTEMKRPATITEKATPTPTPTTTVEASRKRKKPPNGAAGSLSELPELSELQTTTSGSSGHHGSISSPYVGTRSTRRKTSNSANPTVSADVSPITLRGTSPPRHSALSKHVHFTGNGSAVGGFGRPGRPAVPAQAVMSPSPATQIPSSGYVGLGLQSDSPAPITSGPRQPFNVNNEDNDDADVDVDPNSSPPDPLEGLTVHIIHVKDTLTDGPSPGEIILNQLNVLAGQAGLDCEFDITDFGESIWV